MMNAKNVLAINIDRDAPMVTKADWAVIADLHQVVPAISGRDHPPPYPGRRVRLGSQWLVASGCWLLVVG